ncbi:MAG: aromatic ring-hydroxylating dioxygenase subunit alpha [Pseudomonadota bacterium]
MEDQALAEALAALRATVGRAPDQAVSLPPALYGLDSVHAYEREKIFAREWLCLGRADELPEAGDYRAFELIGEPLILLRDESGTLRVFANICRHRLSRLLNGTGRVKRIVCPYHAWTYDLTGQLRAASHMKDGFDPTGIRLPELKTEIWEGFLFTNFDPEAAPLAPRLAALSAHIANYRVGSYEAGFQVEEVWDGNWKVLVENFTDAYHLSVVHATTVAPALPTRLSEMKAGGEDFSLFDQHRVPGSAFEHDQPYAPNNPALTDEERLKIPLFAVFPTLLVSVSPERLFWVLAQPLGTDRIAVRWGIDSFPGLWPDEGTRDYLLSKVRVKFDAINQEDKDIVRQIRRNAESRFAAQGPLSTKERPLINLAGYLARML